LSVAGVAIVVRYREAFEAHQASPHFEGIAVAQIRPLLSNRSVEFCQVIEPDAG
jgi:hypothetical protein